jgi:hypothetical protein
MRVEVNPRSAVAAPGKPAVFTIQVFNTEPLISGHRIRVLGADSEWTSLDKEQISLFPDTTGVAVLAVTFPMGSPAGARRVSVEVSEITEPYAVEVVDLDLEIPSAPALAIKLDPVSISAGRHGALTAIVSNTGNITQEVKLEGEDDERQVTFSFSPEEMSLVPAESRAVNVGVAARRPLTGSPKVRPFKVTLSGDAPTENQPPQGLATFVQKAWLTRGHLALIGLLLAATVFAAVLAVTLSRISTTSSNNSNAVMQALEASINSQPGASGGTGAASIAGTVTLVSAPSQGVAGVTVELFVSSDTSSPLASTATKSNGAYAFLGLTPGSYKLEFTGAGFMQIWYPDSTTAAGASAIQLAAGQVMSGANVRLGGLPANVSGTVTGPAPADATVALEVSSPNSALNSAVVSTTTTDASGNFTLANVPSPANYQLVVTKPGYASAMQPVDLASGEADTGVTLLLQLGDGSVAGTVSGSSGPLPGATISATGGSSGTPVTASTVSLTTGKVGSFVIRNLPTPGTYTVLVTAPGYASQTLSVSLSAAQQLTGLAVVLASGSGTIEGKVLVAGGSPAGGIKVTVSGGPLSITTATLSEGNSPNGAGTFEVTGLPAPATYEVTFSRAGLIGATREVQLLPAGASDPPPGVPSTTSGAPATSSSRAASSSPASAGGLNVTMVLATADIYGKVTDQSRKALTGIGISVSSGTTTYAVTSVNRPVPGEYEIDGIAPGTYTVSFTRPGAQPTSSVVTLSAGQRLRYNAVLAKPASIDGYVSVSSGGKTKPLAGAVVTLYLATQYPSVALLATTTGSDGYYLLPGLNAPEQYIAQFSYPPGTPGRQTIEVTLAPSQQAHLQTVVLSGSGPATTSAATTSPTAPGTGPSTTGPRTTAPLVATTAPTKAPSPSPTGALPPTVTSTAGPTTTAAPTTTRAATTTTVPATTVPATTGPTTNGPTTTVPATTGTATTAPVTTKPPVTSTSPVTSGTTAPATAPTSTTTPPRTTTTEATTTTRRSTTTTATTTTSTSSTTTTTALTTTPPPVPTTAATTTAPPTSAATTTASTTTTTAATTTTSTTAATTTTAVTTTTSTTLVPPTTTTTFIGGG